MDIGKILLSRKLVTAEQLQAARAAQSADQRLDEAAVNLGFVSEEQALRAVGEAIGLEYLDLEQAEVDLKVLDGFPHKLIHRHTLFPVHRHNGSLVVATSDPFDFYPLDEISSAMGVTVEPVLAGRSEIAKRIKNHLGVGSETIEGLLAAQDDDEAVQLLEDIETDGSELSEQAQEASVVRLVNEILLEAIESRASDVHIETQASGLKIRYRIDGVLLSQPVPPEINRFQAAIISRLKIMARLNIAEKRLPQDGRIKLRVSGREVDVRVSVIPMIHGEGIVMRLLDKGSMDFNLEQLGMSYELFLKFRELIQLPHGIILVTGPTGSGKSTTLYSSLLEIKNDTTKIITAEDPVEYQLDGINQIQVHPKIGLTFAASLRSILRHDPDVVLVGEIRDLETAENAIQASLTGHLVFSTLHTNDAPSAYTRLVDMGVEPFLVASTVEAVMAQRLLRVLCHECRESYQPDQGELPSDFPWEKFLNSERPLMRNRGCRACRQTGYRGRKGIFELSITSDAIRGLAHDNASSWEIRKAAVRDGMITLREDGWRKVIEGETTVDEVLRVTKGDRIGDRLKQMPEFAYTARDISGGKVTGVVTAATSKEAAATLSGKELFPLEISASSKDASGGRQIRVKARAVAPVYSQLAALIRSGVPLLKSLAILKEQTSNQSLAAVLEDIHKRVEEGATLADAMGRHPRAFGDLAVGIVRAGGEGGFLEEALDRVATFTEQQDELKSRVVGALAYPIFLAVVGTIVVNVLVIFFVPRFEALFARLKSRGELPEITEWLIATSQFLQSYGLLIVAGLVIAGFMIRTRLQTEEGKVVLDRMRLRIPQVSSIYLSLAVARFCRVLGTLLAGGVAIVRSLEISSGAAGNRVLATAIRDAADNISAGESLAAPLAECGYFPRNVVEMIIVAEESNSLETVLVQIADSLERETWRRLDLFVRLLEPIMLLVLAIAVLLVVIALLLPVLKMSTTM